MCSKNFFFVAFAILCAQVAGSPACKCGTFKKTGKHSCCAHGGDWFENCGGNFDHTWVAGLQACKNFAATTKSTTKSAITSMTAATTAVTNRPIGTSTASPTTRPSATRTETAKFNYERDFQLCKTCPDDAVPCEDWPSQTTRKLKPDQCGSHLCCQVKSACDVCNGQKDKPQKLRLRWVGNSGAPSSVTFSSQSICVKPTTLTSGSKSNEVVLDAASCFGSGSKLPTNIHFQVDGSSKYFHASCSQPLNLGDVLYTDKNKGFLVLVGFRAMSGRTDGGCSGARPQTKNECDACNGQKDKPQKLRLRWEGKAGAPSSITFSSTTTCVQDSKLTSESKDNEVVLDAASCFGSGRSLPSNVYFKVDGLATFLHTSCSQPLNLGDVIYMDKNKGSLVLAGFRSMSGRTDRACSGGPAPSQDQCTCTDAKECFGDVLYQLRKKNYRLECEPVKPQICEAVTTVNIYPEDCSTTARGCSHGNGFKVVMCPCSKQCFDGKSCPSSECPCNSIDCSDWSSRKPSLLDYIKRGECVCTGGTPCLTDFNRPKCDVCNLRKDKPQTLVFRWVGKAGAQSSINFQSAGTCSKETILTSGSKSNEVMMDASCFGSESKLPTNMYFKVDGATAYLHASCSQPLNVGDVVFKHRTKGSLILVRFRSVSGRTDRDCPKLKHTCGPRSVTTPSLSCGAGITLQKRTSTKGVSLRINPDFSIQYMWSQTRHGVSPLWTDHFEYTGKSCDGENVKGKVIIYVRQSTTTATASAPKPTSTTTTILPTRKPTNAITVSTPKPTTAPPTLKRTWGDPLVGVQCNARQREVILKRSSTRVSTIDKCKKSCEDAAGCQSVTYFKNGWCSHFSTSCKKIKRNLNAVAVSLVAQSLNLNSNSNNTMFEHEIEHEIEHGIEYGNERDTDLSVLQEVDDICSILMIVYLFNTIMF